MGANRRITGLGDERRRRVARHLVGCPASFADPLLARAVDQPHLVVAVVLQIPVGVRREPVVAVAIEDDRVLVGDATRAEQRAEVVRAEEIPLQLVLEVQLPVEADRPRDVCLGVERRVLIYLDDTDRVVIEMLLKPRRVNEHLLRVLRHGSPPG